MRRACRPRRCTLRSFATSGSRPVLDIATPTELKKGGGQVSEKGNVLLVEKQLQWRPLARPNKGLITPTGDLFCQSGEVLKHTSADAARFFQFDSSSRVFPDFFYHTGFCGHEKQLVELKTAATMVRQPGLGLRDELLGWQASGRLGQRSGIMLTGPRGCGKSTLLNYAIAACHEAGWLVVNIPRAADWTLGLSARSAQEPNEAYRVTDDNYFKEVPPELAASPLYEAPDASLCLLISVFLSQREKLGRIKIKCPERRAYYAAKGGGGEPTLADVVAPVCVDEGNTFSDFPMPLRPIHDFLAELQTVTEFPVLLVVDGWNYWHHMATSKRWKAREPLHACDLLVPSMLADAHAYGSGMANGVMLCALTLSGASPPSVPRNLRAKVPPPPSFMNPQPEMQRQSAAEVGRRARAEGHGLSVRRVPAYSADELQRCLEFYAYAGHLRNRGLQEQLRTGDLRRKVALMTNGVGEDVYAMCRHI